MTRKQALQIGPVMVDYANGAEVECKEVAIIGKDVWHSPPDPDNPSFAPSAEWRMKIYAGAARKDASQRSHKIGRQMPKYIYADRSVMNALDVNTRDTSRRRQGPRKSMFAAFKPLSKCLVRVCIYFCSNKRTA